MAGILETLAQTWPARLAQDVWGGITAPRDAYQGTLDPLSPEAISRMNSLAGMMTGTPLTPQGALGSSASRFGFSKDVKDFLATQSKQAPKLAAESAVPIEMRIRRAFNDISGGQDAVRLHELRAKLPDVGREELDNTLLSMQKSGEANLMGLDNPRDIKAVGSAALRDRGNDYHAVFLGPST